MTLSILYNKFGTKEMSYFEYQNHPNSTPKAVPHWSILSITKFTLLLYPSFQCQAIILNKKEHVMVIKLWICDKFLKNLEQ